MKVSLNSEKGELCKSVTESGRTHSILRTRDAKSISGNRFWQHKVQVFAFISFQKYSESILMINSCSTSVPCISLRLHFLACDLLSEGFLRTFSFSLPSLLLPSRQGCESVQPGSANTASGCFHWRLVNSAVDPGQLSICLVGQADRHQSPVLLLLVLRVAPEIVSIHRMQRTLF